MRFLDKSKNINIDKLTLEKIMKEQGKGIIGGGSLNGKRKLNFF